MSNGLITRLMRPAIATLLYRITTVWKLHAWDLRVYMQSRAEISAAAVEQRWPVGIIGLIHYWEREKGKRAGHKRVIINTLIKICYSTDDFPMLRILRVLLRSFYLATPGPRKGSRNDTAPAYQSRSSVDRPACRGASRLSLIYQRRSTRVDRNELHSSPRAPSRTPIMPTGPATGIRSARSATLV